MNNTLFVVTISHQLGSGGAYVGRKLSEQLNIPFIDREILRRVSEQLNLVEAQLEQREERLSSFWESLSRIVALADPQKGVYAGGYVPTDKDLFRLESDYIKRIAEKASAVILGRCGRYILRDQPRHVSILVHADMPARVRRISTLYRLSEEEARKLIDSNDKDRAAYIQSFTRQDWLDARLYDLCVNTSSIGLDSTVELVLAAVAAKIH